MGGINVWALCRVPLSGTLVTKNALGGGETLDQLDLYPQMLGKIFKQIKTAEATGSDLCRIGGFIFGLRAERK